MTREERFDTAENFANMLMRNNSMSWSEKKPLLLRVAADLQPHIQELVFYYAEICDRQAASLKEMRALNQEFKKQLDQLTEPPLFTGKVLKPCNGQRKEVLVASGSVQMYIAAADGVDIQQLQAGQSIILSKDRNCIVGVEETLERCGDVAVVQRVLGTIMPTHAVVKVRETEEMVVRLSHTLSANPPKEGDSVIFDRQYGLAMETLPAEGAKNSLLEDVDSSITLDMVGGLAPVITDICNEIMMQIYFRKVMLQHEVDPAKGILLVSAPGMGKTMMAKGLANFVKEISGRGMVKFMSLAPGAHRHFLYGSSDQHIIKIFKEAREFTASNDHQVVLFLDELQNWGTRSADVGNTIDSRVLDTLLAQIDGIDDSGRILLIAASNRADDLIDPALTRPGRFGDLVFRIPRPDRVGARDIFRKYLKPTFPYKKNGQRLPGHEASEMFIDAALARMYAHNGDAVRVATLVMRDGSRQEVHAAELVSGAVIKNICRKAKHLSCMRVIEGYEPGICLEDLLKSVDEELYNASKQLSNPRNARHILELSSDLDFRVEFPEEREMALGRRAYQFVN